MRKVIYSRKYKYSVNYRSAFFLLTLLVIFSKTEGYFLHLKSRNFNVLLFDKEVTVENLDNKEVIKIMSGSPLSLAAVRSGMRLSFQCKQGTCASCETILDGKVVRTCITRVPEKNKITLKKPKGKS